MSNMSKYLEMEILTKELSDAYLSLYRSNPSEDDTGTEVGTDGYERQKINFSQPYISSGHSAVKNDESIVFAPVDGGYGDITHIGIRDAQYGGNLLFFAALGTQIESKEGSVRVEPGKLIVTLD